MLIIRRSRWSKIPKASKLFSIALVVLGADSVKVLQPANNDIQDINFSAIEFAFSNREKSDCHGQRVDYEADFLSSLVQMEAVNSCDSNGENDLIAAAGSGDLAKLSILLSRGCDVNQVDHRKQTALHQASKNGHVHVVNALLRAEGLAK